MQPMRWKDLFRGERGEITPHASRGTHEFDQAYGFDVEEYPALVEAADAWAEGRSWRQRWRLRLRSKLLHR
jgi:hypothetical protein